MEDRKAAIKKYDELKIKYKLPTRKELEKEFDFELEDTAGIPKEIINQIWERITSIKSYIEGALNPQRYCCMIETKFFNPKEKEKVFDFYKKIMIEYWKTVQATFRTKEEKVKQINKSFEFYKKVKKFSEGYIQKMIDGWSEGQEKEEKNGHIY
jgi:hypothetical protein